jgi:hypothetical protein
MTEASHPSPRDRTPRSPKRRKRHAAAVSRIAASGVAAATTAALVAVLGAQSGSSDRAVVGISPLGPTEALPLSSDGRATVYPNNVYPNNVPPVTAAPRATVPVTRSSES